MKNQVSPILLNELDGDITPQRYNTRFSIQQQQCQGQGPCLNDILQNNPNFVGDSHKRYFEGDGKDGDKAVQAANLDNHFARDVSDAFGLRQMANNVHTHAFANSDQ